MKIGERCRASRSPISTAAAVVVVVVVEIAMIAAVVTAGVAAVIFVTGVAPSRRRVDGLHRDLGTGLGCCVESLSPRVILCPELYCRLHGDLSLLGKAVAAIGWRWAAVTWGRCAI